MHEEYRSRNFWITAFVIVWLLVFHYESTRFFFLNRMSPRPLPKVPLLFPPAGWIMFFRVTDDFGYVEVYGIKDGVPQVLDPHEIFSTRFIGFDNIQRNVLSTVLARQHRQTFCYYLQRKFPEFERFAVTQVFYPSVTQTPRKRLQQAAYQCP